MFVSQIGGRLWDTLEGATESDIPLWEMGGVRH